MSAYRFHPEAERDLDDIWEHLAAHNIEAADRVAGEIEDRFRALAAFPRQGFKRPDLTSRPLRFVLVRDYVIAYAPDAKPLWVVAVMHARRSPRVMAAILRGRE